MKMRHRQSGMSILGMLAVGIMVGFFVITGLRLAPHYFEYMTIKDAVTRTATEYDAENKSIKQLRTRLTNLFTTNQVYNFDPNDIKIYRKEGKVFIDANYEARFPVMGRIDGIMTFDDLLLEVGKPAP
jgi:Domain of unknown function (DUF4845)